MNDWKNAHAAIFDVDGTLIRLPSIEFRFGLNRLRERKVGLLKVSAFGIQRALGLALREDRGRRDKGYLEGVAYTQLVKDARAFVEALSESLLISTAVERLREHQKAGASCFLLTGALEPLAQPLADKLGVDHVVATRLGFKDAHCTGRVTGTHPYGEGKKALLDRLCKEQGLEPGECAAYADRYSDLPLLEAVGYPVAVRPDRKLRAAARERGWEVLT